jgi:hypothetical protein
MRIYGVFVEGDRETEIFVGRSEGDEHVDFFDRGGVVVDGFEDADPGETYAVEGREQGGLQIAVQPGELFGGF